MDKPLNTAGAKYWRSACSHEKYKKTIEKLAKYDPQAYWDNRAESWIDQSDARYSFPKEDEKIIKKWIDELDFESIIDLGCGSGRFTHLFEGKKYVGIDISDRLIRESRNRYPDLRFSTMRVEDAKEFKEKFDLVFSYTTLEHIAEDTWPQAVEAIKSIGKKAIIVEPVGFDSVGYCFSHDYAKDFKVLKKKTLSDKTLFLVEL